MPTDKQEAQTPETENRGTTHPLPETLRYDQRCGYLWDGSLMVADLDATKGEVVRIRGWGHLTGTGGLGMTDNEAATYQDRVGRRIEASWNSHEQLVALLTDIGQWFAERNIQGGIAPSLQSRIREALVATGDSQAQSGP